jgi:hypothetical protein
MSQKCVTEKRYSKETLQHALLALEEVKSRVEDAL